MDFLQNCDNIKLNNIMRIQNRGCFLVINTLNNIVTHYSENLLINLNDTIYSVFKNNKILFNIKNFINSGNKYQLIEANWTDINTNYKLNNTCVIDCELEEENIYITISNINSKLVTKQLTNITSKILKEQSLEKILEISALNLCEILKSDRVMIYKFDNDFNGMVIFEKTFGYANMTSYMGLLFPSEDIPLSARELYKKNRVRFIYNIEESDIEIIGATPIDMTKCMLRGVAKPHIEYLLNMGVISSISISLIVNNKLWGLLVYHYYSKDVINVDLPIFDICYIIGNTLSFQIENFNLKEQYNTDEILKNLTSKGVSDLNIEGLLLEVSNISSKILNLFCILYSEAPKDFSLPRKTKTLFIDEDFLTNDICDQIINEIDNIHKLNQEEYQIYNTEIKIENISYNIASFKKNDHLLLFVRRSIIMNITWAGNPDEAKKYSEDFLHPRKSFEMFKEKRIKHPEEWSENNLKNLNILGKYILEIFEQDEIRKSHNEIIEMEVNSVRKLGILAGISHELRNCFNGIIGPIELLEDSLKDEEQLQMINIIKQSTLNATSMLDDILSYNQLTNQLNLVDKKINLKDFFKNIKTLIKSLPLYEKNKIEIISELNRNSDNYICNIDPVRINQIILNLVGNSIKFSDSNSKIIINWNIHNNINDMIEYMNLKQLLYEHHIESSTLNLNTESQILEISITDEGTGIPQSFLNKMFSPFTQAPTDNKTKGTGLGLSIVRGIVILLKGTIRCMTGKNGTTFIICIPINIIEKKINVENKKNIFIVDDSLTNIMVIEKFIKKKIDDVNIITFLNAESALEAFNDYEKKNIKVDLLITDVYMDGLSGVDLLKEVKKKNFYYDTPVVLCTGSTTYQNISKNLNCYFLLKPVSKKTIFEIIDKTIKI
jgi:light-regulated signal transduction histidine kinase (bacteriophytochrome)/CheY-like chemotaxis protein